MTEAPKRKGRPRLYATKAECNRAWRLRQDPETLKRRRKEAYRRWKERKEAKA